MMNKLQSGPPWHGQILTMAEIKLRAFFPQQIQIARLRWRFRDRWHQTCPPLHTRKREVLRLADSNCITWAPSIPCCLLSRPHVSRFGHLLALLFINQRSTRSSLAESLCADMGNNDTGILQRSVRSVEPVCFAASRKALFHMKLHGSLTATVPTERTEGSADLEFLHQARRRGILQSERG